MRGVQPPVRDELGGGRLVTVQDLQVLVALGQVFVLDHDFTNRSLLREVQLVHTLLQQLHVNVEQVDYYLRADGLDGRLVLLGDHDHRIRNVLQALDIKLRLVAEHDRELSEEHLEDIEVTNENLLPLSLVILKILRGHTRGRLSL